MTQALLALNAGSSSLKFAVFPVKNWDGPLLRGEIVNLHANPRLKVTDSRGRLLASEELPHAVDVEAGLSLIRQRLSSMLPGLALTAAAHRVVHGGERFDQPVAVTASILDQLEALDPLAPLHQPHNLAAIRALMRLAPRMTQTASFDTAFHASQPDIATRFALPAWLGDEGVRRYGFHGLSYDYIASVLPQHVGRVADRRVIVAHLGQGASMCAMKERQSVATTMGFSALDGLVMGTRCGSIDAGVILYLMDEHGMSSAEISKLLYTESGLKGVSGISDDMRVLLASEEPAAKMAVDLFVYRISRELGSLTAALGGLDALVFTGGIGANSAEIRQRICTDAAWLNARADLDANATNKTRFDAAGSGVALLTLQTDEESVLARDCLGLLSQFSNSA